MPLRGNEFFGSKAYYRLVAIARRQGGDRCAACGSLQEVQVDHIIPRSLGGSVSEVSTMQLMCAPCNTAKGGSVMSVDEIRRVRRARRREIGLAYSDRHAFWYHVHEGRTSTPLMIGNMSINPPWPSDGTCRPECSLPKVAR